MSMSIRPLQATDRARWEELFRAYVRFYDAKIDDGIIDLTWRRLLSGEDGFYGLVAVDEAERPVGFAHLVFHPSTWSPTTYCYLEDLYVERDARRHGTGRALIEAAYREADRRGATRTYWATKEDNRAARRVYDRIATLSSFVQYRR